MWIIYILAAIIIIGPGYYGFITCQTSKIRELTFEDMLLYTTKNNENAVITAGIIKDGVSNYSVYGKNGVLLPGEKHIYEIGSITKTITASLLFKAIEEGKINMEDCIDKYLDLPKKDYYPTIKQILTHTSGYKDFYFESQMVSNFFKNFFNRRNDYYGITKEQLINRIGKINIKNRVYGFKYSNFGISVIGVILSNIYREDYAKIIKKYLKEELGLNNTTISNGLGDLQNYWKWLENDAYLPAGGLTSDIEDMLKYAQLQLNITPEYLSVMHNKITDINATSGRNANMNIRMDSMGATWIIDTNNNIIWHNGGTGNYNSYIGFDMEKQVAVIVLSNLPPNYRIPATVMGVKLLTDLQIESDK